MIITRYNKKALNAAMDLAQVNKLIVQSKWRMKFAFTFVPVVVPGDSNNELATSYAFMRTYYTRSLYRVTSANRASFKIEHEETVNILNTDSMSYFAIENSGEQNKKLPATTRLLQSTDPLFSYSDESILTRNATDIYNAYYSIYESIANTKLVKGFVTPAEFERTVKAVKE